MHFSTIFIALTGATAAVASAIPALEARQAALLCSGLSGTPVCCATDVLGLADLDCAPPPETPANVDEFTDICAAIGQRARCCTLPILGQALICAAPVGP